MSGVKGFSEKLAQHRLLVILRADNGDRFVEIAVTLHQGGIRLIEATLTTPGALEIIAALRSALPMNTLVGAGSVRTPLQVKQALDAGADFLVTPVVNPAVLECARGLVAPVLCGALTPTEIAQAWEFGATAIKVFPAREAGGVPYIKAVHTPLPEIPLVPTGGVALSEVDSYLSSGAIAVAVGSPILGDAIHGGDLEEMAARAEAFVRACER